jgi:hypothetical protein
VRVHPVSPVALGYSHPVEVQAPDGIEFAGSGQPRGSPSDYRFSRKAAREQGRLLCMERSSGARDTCPVDGVEGLRNELSNCRTVGEVFVWCARHARGEDAEQAVRDLMSAPPAPLNGMPHEDLVVERQAKSADGRLGDLEAVDADTARGLLAHVLQFDLAYGGELIDRDTAARLAHAVIEFLPAPVRWWTNGTIGLPGDGGVWNPLTDATFDTGVIGVHGTDCSLPGSWTRTSSHALK